jgi:hypothetical protein
MSNDTRFGTFVIEKNSKKNHGFLLVLDWILGTGFYELQHVYSMHVTFVEIIDLFGKFKFRCN